MKNAKLFTRVCGIALVSLIVLAFATTITSVSAAIYTPNSVETWAVIVCGGSAGGAQQEDFENEIAEAYNTLLGRAYGADHVYYLDITYPRDVTGDGVNDVDAVSTKANVQYAIINWLKTHADSNDICFVYLVNHGGTNAFSIAGELIYAYEMAGWLFHVTCGELIFTIEACNSGSFIDELSGLNRIIVTSCEATESAWPDPNTDWPAFSHTFFQRLAAMNSIGDAFNVAYQHVIQVRPQHPLLDDNHDRVGHRGPLPNGGDGNFALSMCWLPGDVNNDEKIDLYDVVRVSYAYGTSWTRADINNDGKVDLYDVVIVSHAYGSRPGDPNWNPVADINQDGIVDMIDVTIVSCVYGTFCSSNWDPRADLNDDWVVDGTDVSIVSSQYGRTCPAAWDAQADLNNDWVIDGMDLSIVSRNYGYVP